jgi:RNA polymerase sigma-70 factor, ECF subfamily
MIDQATIAKAPALPLEAGEPDGERQLVLRAQNGSVAAFERLVERYERRILRLAQNITHQRQDAEDVVQNAFTKAFSNLPLFRGDSRFYTWLVRITVNEALMKIRSRHFVEVSIDELIEAGDVWISLEIQDCRPNPELRYAQQELQGFLLAAIDELEPVYRTVFQLCHIDGLSAKETAQALGVTSSAVKARLQRARMRLRHSLENYFRPMDAKARQALGGRDETRQRQRTRPR